MSDYKRAKSLGISLEQFQSLVGYDPQIEFPEFTKGEEELFEDSSPFAINEDISGKEAYNLDHYWTRPVLTPEDEALYYGYHIHSKDNVYGLHAHYPGGPLGGGHTHGPQNRLGYHTHRFDVYQLKQFKFARPGIMIEIDGPHEHQMNAPDGCHEHQSANFGPATE